MDYRKLAEEFGGRAEPQSQEAPSVDYRALAEQFGGTAEEVEPTVRAEAPSQPAEPPSFFDRFLEAAKPEPFTRQILDVPIGVTKGGVTGFRMLADAFGAGSGVSESIKSSEKYLEGLMSAQARNDSAEVSRIMKDAEDKGFGDQVRAAIQAFSVAPIDLVSQALGTAAPVILGGLATTVLGGGALATAAVTTGLAGATGAGLIKGNIYDAVKEEMLKAGDPPALAERKALQAQEYGGKNLDMILAGTALGAIAGRTGVEKLILNKIAAKEAAEQGLLRRTGEGAVTEAVPEFFQAGQEALATNIALQREGLDVPTMRGVVGQATLEGLAGSALGAAAGAVSKPRAADTKEDKAIADLDKLAVDEEAEAATSGLVSEEDLFAEEAAGRIPAAETVPATLEELKKIDKDLKKKLGRTPTTDEVEKVLNDFEQEKTRRLRAESGGRKPPVSVPSGEEAAAGVTGAPARTEPTGLGEGVGATASVGARKEPTTGALKPKDQINTAKQMMADISKQPLNVEGVSGNIVGDVKSYKGFKFYKVQEGSETFWKAQSPENQALNRIGRGDTSHDSLGLAKDAINENLDNKFDAEMFAQRLLPRLTKEKEAAPTEAATTAPEGTTEESTQTYEEALAEDYKRRGLDNPDEVSKKIQESRNVSKKVADAYVQALRKREAERIKFFYGLGSEQAFREAGDLVEKIENRIRGVEKRREGKQPLPTEEAAAPTEPIRFRTVEDLSPEDRAAYESENAEIRASMKEATDAAKERGIPFPNAAAPFVDQLRALDQSYGIGERISEGKPEIRGVRPARDEEEEVFGERRGELKSDKAQMLRILSGSMYGSGIQDVAVKELLQNAFDSVKEAVYKGIIKGFGTVNITLDEENKRITVTDNGMGMTTKIVDEGFFTVGGTKKDVPPELRSGGYGVAKVAFMTSTEEISLDTVRDGVRNIVKNATPLQITEGDFKIKTEPAPKNEHGTTVVVDIPNTYIDRTGKEQSIYFFDRPEYVTPLTKPLIGPVEVKVKSIAYGRTIETTLPVGINFDYKSTPLLTKVNFDWGSADIYYGVERKDQPNHVVLSSGVYQFDGNFALGPGEIIPYDIIINVKPKVEASSSDYPFTLEREKFRDSHKKDVEALTAYLVQVARGAEAAGLQDTFKNIISMPKVDVGGVNPQTEEKLRKLFNKSSKPPEFKPFEAPEEINVGDGKVTTTKGFVLLDTNKKSEREKEGTFAAEKEAPKIEQFMNQMGQDPRQPIFHNNTNLDYIAIGEPYGDPQAFFAELGSLFIDMKEAVANGMYRYAKLKPPNLWFTGISIDKTYGGLSILVPFKGAMINPFYGEFGEKTLTGARERMLDTMIHELAHADARNHGVSHNSEMIKIKLFLSDSGKYDAYRDKLLEILVKHESTFAAMKESYDRSTTKNTAQSLEDYNKATTSRAAGVDANVGDDQLRSLSARERPGRDGDLRPVSRDDKKIPDSAGISESDAELEQLVTQLDLKVGDIHPTMISAISNNDLNGALRIASQKLTGFSADLAKALLDLKLPTNISFNNGRDLVRRSIDSVSAQQQKRLFRYVEMHYPQVYDKYFKNYDRSESLEAVSKGLAELRKPNYNLGPVAAEFQTVSEAYDKSIEGLTAPGAYSPQFDEITLNTNTRTGKSYRAFLHEVVHAATEYVLNTYGTNKQELTPGQREAVEELTKMYNYAVEKLGKEPYGMTNIYEFISEVFTNKKFQELLKGVKYEPKKTPFLNRLVKAILNAFGLDNLAGNAMAEATKIFSAVRTEAPLAAQPRFAGSKRGKRVRGPISSPQTSRTQEQGTQSYIGTMNLALTGRMTWSKAIKIMGSSFWDARNTQLRQVVLGFMNLSHLAEITQDKFPQIIGTIRLIEKMIEYRLSILNEAADISKRWTVAQFKNPRQSQLMARIMLEATMRSLDPDDPKGQPVNAALLQAWTILKPEFKQIYRDVRDFYRKSVERMIKELEDRVNNSSLSQQEKEKSLAEIAAQFGPDKLVSPYFPLRRFGEFFFQVNSGDFKEFYEHESADARNLAMNNRIDELSKGNAQQRALVGTVYPGNGVSEIFSQNRGATGVLGEVQNLVDSIGNITTPPTKAQYDAAEKVLQKELNRTPTKEEVEKRFERDEIKKELKDNINQLLYVLLPQQSMRKMFINRKNIQGASEDMLRVFSTSAIHSAYQQSRFKFSDKLHNNITNALDDIRNNPLLSRSEKEVYRDFVIELEKRMPVILSAEDTSFAAKVAGRLSETTFFFMLSAPFSAMLNTIGMAQIALPYIGGKYGYDKTAKLMTKNMLRYTSTIPTRTIKPLAKGDFLEVKFPSLAEGYSFKNEPVLHRAAFELAQEGQYEISLVNDFMMLAEAPSALYTGYMATVKKIMSSLFHQTERLNREVVSITVFEMAYEKFTTEPKKDTRGVVERDAQGNPVMNTPEEAFQLAMAEAKDMVRASLGDFSRQMKPRYFVGPAGSIIFKFKQYPVLVTYILLRNLKLGFGLFRPFERKKLLAKYEEQLINDKVSPAVIKQRVAEYEAHHKAIGKEARRRMAGILAVTYLLGGNEASPFYSIGLGVLVNMFADDEDDEFFDWENWVKNYVQVELGGAAGDLFAEMGMNPEVSDSLGDFIGDSIQKGVVSTITGGNFADRVSLDPVTMFYREGRYSPDVRESLTEAMIANAGPTVGLAFNWVEAYRLMQEGQYQRAFEKSAPALFAKPVTAARLAEEGGKTAKGDVLVDEFSAWEIAMQSIGLQPVRLNTAQKRSIEVVQREQKLKDRREALMNRLWMERNNFDTFNDILEEANEFSAKYPLFAIDAKAIKESFDQRAEDQAQANNIGARVNKKFIPEALQMMRYGRE